jgi:hypothetical protein
LDDSLILQQITMGGCLDAHRMQVHQSSTLHDAINYCKVRSEQMTTAGTASAVIISPSPKNSPSQAKNRVGTISPKQEIGSRKCRDEVCRIKL